MTLLRGTECQAGTGESKLNEEQYKQNDHVLHQVCGQRKYLGFISVNNDINRALTQVDDKTFFHNTVTEWDVSFNVIKSYVNFAHC